MPTFPARIHVLLASEAPIGLVIRRGPSKSVATILWNRQTDEFQFGQWLKGRIYERRSDLSPDGKHFIYFAMNGKMHTEAGGYWTAISRTPYLKALAIFTKGDCWHGGGLWTSNSEYWLNDGYGHKELRDTAVVRRDLKWNPTESYGGECPGVYYPRLMRDGWTFKGKTSVGKWKDQFIFEKPCNAGWLLRKVAHAETGAPPGKGCYWDEHELVHLSSGVSIQCPHWEWAEIDGERIVWATEGRIVTAQISSQGLIAIKALCDFNDMAFTRIQAPY